jgi:WD40 repeat protein
MEIVCASFDPQSTCVATGSMDTRAKLWDVESGKEIATLKVKIYQFDNLKGPYRRNCQFEF